MEVLNNQATELTGSVTVKVEKEDYDLNVNNRLKELRKNVTMRGFRPGHVPMQLVKKIYGKEILLEEVNKIVWDALIKFIKDNDLKLIGDFIADEEKTKFDVDKDEAFEFTFDYGTYSKPFINYDEITAPFYKVEVTDTDIDNEIDRIRKSFGQYIEKEQIDDDKDIFYVSMVELDENGQAKEDGLRKDEVLLAFDLIDSKLHEQFIGKKKGDELNVKLDELVPDKKRRAAMLNLKEEDLDNISNDFKVVITNVKRFQEAEIGEELFKKYAPTEEIKDEEQFRNKVKENLENYYKDTALEVFKRDIKDLLMKSVEVEIAEDFLLRWLEKRQKEKEDNKRLTREELEKQLPEIVKSIKWNAIVEQIGEDLGIELEREDAIKVHADMLRMSLMNYGIDLSMLNDDFIMQTAQDGYDKLSEDERYQINTVAFENKVLAALQEKVNLEERTIGAEMLEAKLKEEKSIDTEEATEDEKSAEANNNPETKDEQTNAEQTENTQEEGADSEQENTENTEQ